VKDRRFALICIGLGILACSLIAAYFAYIAPPVVAPDLAQLTALQDAGAHPTDSSLKPATVPSGPSQDNVDKSAGTPDANPAKAEFDSKLSAPTDIGKETPAKMVPEQDFLPPDRLTPDMFAFISLPFDAPIAVFPLAQVGQNNLDWTQPSSPLRSGTSGENMATDNRYSSLSARPPENPPQPPVVITVPGEGTSSEGGGGGLPNEPLAPPPEVSTSGL
jgi:hypothetical protein